jgi:hypothetical protein
LRLRFAIFLLSAAALGYEILLLRLLSIVQWQHFAAMIISIALLGYGASGTFLTLARRFLEPRFRLIFPAAAVMFGVTALLSFAAGQRLPLNPLALPWDWRQLGILTAMYLLFAIPFFCVASAIGLAFSQAAGRIAQLYRADLIGAGAGALGIIFLLGALPPQRCLTVVASVPFVAAAAFLGRTWKSIPVLAFAALTAIALPSAWLRLEISQFKPLAHALRIPGAHIVTERSSALALVSVLESPEVPLRFAPGLSLGFVGDLPEQSGIFRDAAALTVVNPVDPGRLEFLDFTTSAVPYFIRRPEDVLVVNAGGGTEVVNALRHGARRVHAIEIDRNVTAAAGAAYQRAGVTTHHRHARAFLEQHRARFDLIIDSSAAAAGLPVLNESYLYTVEGMMGMIDHLNPDGFLIVTLQVNLPPRDALKLLATSVVALERMGASPAANHLAMIRSWSTITLLVKRTPMMAQEISSIRRFCDDRSLDVAFYAGVPRSETNRFNILDEPYFYDGAVALTSTARDDFLRAYKFHIAPATDDRPYFSHFFRWRTLPEFMRLRVRGGAPLLEIGYLVVFATFIQALLIGILLIVVPVLALRRAANQFVIVTFAALGLAFLFVEIFFIQKLTLLLGHPLLAVAITLASFLVFAGLGSGYSTRLTSMKIPILSICALLILVVVSWSALFRIAVPMPMIGKVVLATVLIAPLAFCMGMPFPMAMAAAGAKNRQWIPWAWSINGCASVASPLAATLLAIHFGFSYVALTGAALYVLTAAGFSSMLKSRG